MGRRWKTPDFDGEDFELFADDALGPDDAAFQGGNLDEDFDDGLGEVEDDAPAVPPTTERYPATDNGAALHCDCSDCERLRGR